MKEIETETEIEARIIILGIEQVMMMVVLIIMKVDKVWVIDEGRVYNPQGQTILIL